MSTQTIQAGDINLKSVLLILGRHFSNMNIANAKSSVTGLHSSHQDLLPLVKERIASMGYRANQVLIHDLLAQSHGETQLKGYYDGAVCLDIFDSAHTLEKLNAVLQVLKPGGELLLVNEVLQDEETQGLAKTWSPKSVESILRIDKSSDGALSVETNADLLSSQVPLFNLIRQCERLGAKECSSGAKGSIDLSSIVELCADTNRFCSRRQKTEEPKEFIKHLNRENLEDFENLFRLAFASEPTPGLWDYKFNHGRGFSLGFFQMVEDDSSGSKAKPQLMAHYGGIKREILYFGKKSLALQIGDVMVNPKGNQSLSRRGPFFKLATTFLEEHIGLAREALLGVGFPNEKAMKVASLLGVYKEVDGIKEIVWPSKKGMLPFWEVLLEIKVDDFSRLGPQVDALWSLMKKDFQAAVIGVRDANYTFDRYFHRPGKNYQVYLLGNRFTRSPLGVLVFNVDEHRFELIDVIAPKAHFRKIIHWARRMSCSHPSDELLLRITQSFADLWMMEGARLNPLDIKIPANAWTHGPSIEGLQGRWWLMSGDMDFV